MVTQHQRVNLGPRLALGALASVLVVAFAGGASAAMKVAGHLVPLAPTCVSGRCNNGVPGTCAIDADCNIGSIARRSNVFLDDKFRLRATVREARDAGGAPLPSIVVCQPWTTKRRHHHTICIGIPVLPHGLATTRVDLNAVFARFGVVANDPIGVNAITVLGPPTVPGCEDSVELDEPACASGGILGIVGVGAANTRLRGELAPLPPACADGACTNGVPAACATDVDCNIGTIDARSRAVFDGHRRLRTSIRKPTDAGGAPITSDLIASLKGRKKDGTPIFLYSVAQMGPKNLSAPLNSAGLGVGELVGIDEIAVFATPTAPGCADGVVLSASDPVCESGGKLAVSGMRAVSNPTPCVGGRRNHVKEPGELCDDGNNVAGDGCSVSCTTDDLDINNQRCSGDTSVKCTSAPGGVAGCGGPLGTCEFWFGPPLSLSTGGIALCVTNQFDGAVSGTVNPETGASAGTAALLARVYNDIQVDRPCPRCLSDPVNNDGVRGGTCQGGARAGLSCDSSGTSAIGPFGSTSLDCPPNTSVLTRRLVLDATDAGSRALTVGASSPNCRAAGYTGLKCPCDVCSLNTAKPCRSDADCLGGEGVCGGAAVGQPTAPNGCADGTCDGSFGGGEGVCGAGPVTQACVKETFRGCTMASDCPLAGDSCGSYLQRCFAGFNGALGDSIVADGSHGTPVNHAWQPTFASVFCVPQMSSPAVNFAMGLPGPGRLQINGRATDNGTGIVCPTRLSFVGFNFVRGLDLGWSGWAHNMKLTSGGKVTVGVTACSGAAPNCGVCTYGGPIPNPGALP